MEIDMARILAVFFMMFFSYGMIFPCSVFQVSHDDMHYGVVNEDGPPTDEIRLLFVPGESGKFGAMYFVYKDMNSVQGGINEKGLYYDGMAGPETTVTFDPPLEVKDWIDVGQEIMETCSTVEEAIAVQIKYDTTFSGTAQGFFVFGDSVGDAAAVEPTNTVVRKGEDEDWFITTNFYLSDPDMAGGGGFDRYDTIKERMENMGDKFSIEYLRDTLDAVHQGNYTKFSLIYDTKNRIIYWYNETDYDNVAIIDLDEELSKGLHYVMAADLTYVSHDEYFNSEPETDDDSEVPDLSDDLSDEVLTESEEEQSDDDSNTDGCSVIIL